MTKLEQGVEVRAHHPYLFIVFIIHGVLQLNLQMPVTQHVSITFEENPVLDIESQEISLLYFWDNEIKQQYDEIFITGERGGTE